MMKSIVTLTMNPAVDLSSSVDHVFPNHKLRCSSPRTDPGGGGVNVSRVIRRLRGESTAIFCAGGATGDMLRASLVAEGVSCLPVAVAGWTRQCVTISENKSGQQFRFVMPGPEISKVECRRVFTTLESIEPFPDYVVASGSLPPGVSESFYAKLAHLVSCNRGRMILDTSGASLAIGLAAGVYLVKPSLRELQTFGMGTVETDADQERVAKEIIRKGFSQAVVVSLGAAGVLLVTASECERLPAPSVAVKSRVGAGDSTVAGITLALARGESLYSAIQFGIAAGSAAVMNLGTELCHREDVEKLRQQMTSAKACPTEVS